MTGITTPMPMGLSPYSGVSVNPFLVPQASQPLQQIQQLLQTVPQQLQQLSQLANFQQHQLQQLQHVLQFIPAQLAQLQQALQSNPQTQQQFGSGIPTVPLWGAAPQAFGAQPGYLM